ncbi:MAG: response regulator [Pseudoxanthomonas sp.]|uniref:response regulator n=1 Tax=Pseudoxanthomonas TaxID=83618 RepID=UPI00138A1DAE|nr:MULTISPECIES: response regulator [Pseudoxanthomonas]KAF1725730.1 response regulator [Pseudoxanthomonas mexicana]MCH2091196.1 response regulator [Pseudoxanthomonas sp.]
MNSAPGTMPSILLVEDDRISAAFLSAALATLPARVHVAEDCAQALAASGPFDAWLIDANLPDGSGTWLLQHLRETDAAASALAHTADATAATRDALLQAGFAEVLIKPLSAQALVDALRAALRGGSDEPSDAADWDDRAALTALAGNPEHVASVRQLFLSELPTTRSACLAAFDRSDHAALRAQLHRLQASCGFAGATALAAIASRWHAAPADRDLRAAFAAACARLLAPAS